ncbi:MAG: VOC family protein [Mycobacteriales bacterium]
MPDNDLMPCDLMSIGRFARLTGVSLHALRHYDDVGLLMPAEVDAASGYRRYRSDQIRPAKLIRALRWADVPIDGIRTVLRADSDDDARAVLTRHRERLRRERDLLAVRIDDVTRLLERGMEMPAIPAGCHPVQIKLAVDDQQKSVAFYSAAFGLRYDVSRRTQNRDFSSFQFGEYGRDDFFLLWLNDDPERCDRPGPSNFSFLVDDVDVAYRRALAAGAHEAVPPRDAEGMPRHSAVTDPDGNWIGLAQGGTGARPVQIMISVDDAHAARAFYQEAFGLHYEVARRTKEQNYSSFVFGEYGRDDFFLLWLLDDPDRLDRPGPSNFSFLVDDLDAVHRRALAAGATEMRAPHDAEGMPRGSAVRDPSGNWIGLAQG